MFRALALAAAFSAVGACSNKPDPLHPVASSSAPTPDAGPVVTDYTAENFAAPPLPTGKVVLADAYGGKHAVDVEIAANEKARTRGLMWRKELANGKGMLFIFPREEFHSFWMRNTLISLDMIFITAGLKVAGVVENTTPHSLESRGVGKPSVYVLEVPAGWSAKTGVRAGSAVELVGTEQVAVE